MPFEEEGEDERQILSLGDSPIKCVLDRLTTLSIPTFRVEPWSIASYIKGLIVP